MSRRVVCVVGTGIAGLACALAAAQAGAAVTACGAEPPTPAPACYVDVVPGMLRDLVRLGLGDACVRAGFPYRRTSLLGQRGQPLFSLDAARLCGQRYPAALGISYDALHALLRDAAIGAGVRVRRGAFVTAIDADAGGQATVRATDGEPEHADMVVLACGAAAPLRQVVFQVEAPSAVESPWFHFITRRPLGLDDPVYAMTPAGAKVHVVPVSGTTAGVHLLPPPDSARPDGAAARRLLACFPGLAGAAAANVPDGVSILRGRAASGLLPAPWSRGRVVAVGDCAHALPPHFGQPAAQALEDAVVLGELLASEDDVASLTAAFERRRLPRVARVLAITSTAAQWHARPDVGTDLQQLANALAQVVHTPA